MTRPQLPNDLAATPGDASVRAASVDYDAASLCNVLRAGGVEVEVSDAALDAHARDWWPVTIGWAAHGELAARPSAVALPATTEQVALVLAACNARGIPVTTQGGRSGVCGGAVPAPGGVALDTTRLAGIRALDTTSLRARVGAGTFGPELEAGLRAAGCTLGHLPQSIELSTVGGWAACRGAGQYSTRYGKIEDLVRGLTVALADGTVVRTGGRAPREAVGPDLTQLFVGSEGTLGVICEVDLVLHPIPQAEGRRAWSFDSFATGLDACRRILARGATPAVLRLYDEVESARHFDVDRHVLVVLDEGDREIVDATLAIVTEECAQGTTHDVELVARWLERRNDVSALAPLWEHGIVVDTMEVAATWGELDVVCERVLGALRATAGTVAASVHQSHAYIDGACVYFTFAGRGDDPDGYYRAAWDAAVAAALDAGASLSHHHGVGRLRAPYVRGALEGSFEVLTALKGALDPRGILNPGVLGLGA